MVIHELLPFCWAELAQTPPPGTLTDVFKVRDARSLIAKWRSKVSPRRRSEAEQRIIVGGLPVPALGESDTARSEWFAAYRQTYLERDVRELAALEHLPDFGRLLTLLALRTGQLLNLSDLARDVQLPFTTLRRYMALLEMTYQVFLLRPYFANVGKRLVKTPKVYLTDTGMACHLALADSWATLDRQGRSGAMVETWALGELRKLIAATAPEVRVWFWKPHGGREVDFLLERGEQLVAVEVKWTQRFTEADTAGLRQCADDLKGRVRLGILIYPGTELIALDRQTIAVPASIFFGVDRPACHPSYDLRDASRGPETP
jgi:predicted AAA+ superfamily ATPase